MYFPVETTKDVCDSSEHQRTVRRKRKMRRVLHSLGKDQGVSSAKGPRVRRQQTDWKHWVSQLPATA